MKKLLNTLYITSEDSYLALDGENVDNYSAMRLMMGKFGASLLAENFFHHQT